MENLKNHFTKSLQAIVDFSHNSYLTFLKNSVEKVSNASNLDQVLSEYNQKLIEFISVNNFALDAEKTNEFSQLLGEAHFYLLCKNKGISLSRIKEGVNKTPDFYFDKNELYFEVKTLSVVSGSIGINKSLEDSLEAQIDIEEDLKKGKKTAIGISEVQPYGDKPYGKDKGNISIVVDTLLEKTRQNIKSGQFPNKKSFLVVNLSIIPPFRTENYVLRPAYCDDYMFPKAISGELWMMAFAKPGAPILGIPEVEGKPGVESIMEKIGILSDTEYEYIAGILFMIHPWRRDAEIWGLYSYKNKNMWSDSEPEIIETLSILTGKNWNDDRDSNGWQLNG